ncbi:MAG TPA: NB-ARC domain-containing protein, partial [Ktedonobacteraceae bacterium]|nr:NB-ARC domain-containing protein [Ktedonobacteraceae bacterium]
KDIVDLAALEVSDVALDVPPLRYGAVDRSASAVVERCWAVGFPRFKERVHDPKPLRLSAQVNGEIPTGENLDQPLLTLQVRRSPRPLPSSTVRESEWSGMSGATVFSGNNIIVGVITEHHLPEGESALTVVPITALDLLPEAEATKWWKLVGVDRQAFVRLPGEASRGTIEAEQITATNVVSGLQYIETQIIQQVAGNQRAPLPEKKAEWLFMAADLPPDLVTRQEEFGVLKRSILSQERDRPTAIVAALRGAGGYGKTTLALALCHDPEIKATFHDGILWVTLGEKPVNIVAKIEELVLLLTHEQPRLTSVEAAVTKLRAALADRSYLLVIDDVWRSLDLTPFLQGGPQCTRLVTTRNDQVIPSHAVNIPVDAMHQSEAIQLLQTGLGGEGNIQQLERIFQDLSAQLGEWPLLLSLANGMLRQRVHQHEPLRAALDYLQRAYRKRGVVAFDAKNADARSEAVAKTLDISVEELTEEDAARYRELALFPEDVDVPLVTVQRLWQTTGGLDDVDTEDVCQQLLSLSLLLVYDLRARSIRLHDVVRNYLQKKMGTRLPEFQRQFLDSYGLRRWSDLSPEEPYLWHYVAEHLIAAERREILVASVKEIRYLAKKILVCGVPALERDLMLALEQEHSETILVLLRQCVSRYAHLLGLGKTLGEVEAMLVAYCNPKELGEAVHETWEQEMTGLALTAWHSLPGLSNSALVRTFVMNGVGNCAISADGSVIVSASSSGETLKVWDCAQGSCLTTFYADNQFTGCAWYPDGVHLVATGAHGVYFLRMIW